MVATQYIFLVLATTIQHFVFQSWRVHYDEEFFFTHFSVVLRPSLPIFCTTQEETFKHPVMQDDSFECVGELRLAHSTREGTCAEQIKF